MVLKICLVMVWLGVTWLGGTGIIQNRIRLGEVGTEVAGLVFVLENLVVSLQFTRCLYSN